MKQSYINKLRHGAGSIQPILKYTGSFLSLLISGYRTQGPQIVKPVQRNIPKSSATNQQLLRMAGVKIVGQQVSNVVSM